MKERLVTAIVLILAVLPPLWFGGILLDILIAAFVCIALYEMITVCYKKCPVLLYVFCAFWTVLLTRLSLSALSIHLTFMILFFFTIPVFKEKFSVENISYIMSMILVLVFTVKGIKLVYDYDRLVMMYILIATYMTDTGAYFAGRYFGKHKLNERISPKKTIEGSIGGYLLGAITSFVFGATFVYPMLSVWFIGILSLLMPIFGQIGDLAFSAIKRHFNVKDYGSIFPGHGGVLDRIDSLIFNLLLFYGTTQSIIYFMTHIFMR